MSQEPPRSEDGLALMQVVHRVTSAHAGRSTLDLNVRQRLVIQVLGLARQTSPVAIGQRLGFSPSTMTGLVDRLEEQRYLRRRPHPTDRRAVALELTAKGQKVFAQEVEFYRALAERVLKALRPPERALVLRALSRLEAVADASAA